MKKIALIFAVVTPMVLAGCHRLHHRGHHGGHHQEQSNKYCHRHDGQGKHCHRR